MKAHFSAATTVIVVLAATIVPAATAGPSTKALATKPAASIITPNPRIKFGHPVTPNPRIRFGQPVMPNPRIRFTVVPITPRIGAFPHLPAS